MRFATDLGARERGVYRASFEDGLLDLFCGLVAALMGVAWIFDIVALGPIAPAVLLPLWPLARRRIVEPRTGFVRLRPEREAREKQKYLGFFGIGCVALAAGVVVYLAVRDGGTRGWGHLVAGLPAVLLGLGAVIAGFAFGLPRFFGYAALFVLAGAATIHWRLDPGWSMLAGGFALVVGGSWLLARFVRQHLMVAGNEPQ